MVRRILCLLLAACLLTATALAVGVTGSVRLDEGGRVNAEIAARALDGWTVAPGDAFSFRAVLATCEGLSEGVNGAGETVMGGGVDQTASALYEALRKLPAGMVSFEEISLYGDAYTGGYVSNGGQAVLIDGDSDLRFFNLSGDALIISAKVGQEITCTIASGSSADGALKGSSEVPGLSITPQKSVAAIEIACEGGQDELANIRLAVDSIYDTTIVSGDVFSFNAALGPRDGAYGYRTALNGAGELVPGGGVDQLASALWLIVRDSSDMAVVSKSVYERYQGHYVSSAADAIRTDDETDTDFAFRYTGPGTLTLYTTLSGSALRLELYRE